MVSTQKPHGEVEKLKAAWLRDPCWDIEETEGFEAHREDLLAFRLEREAHRRQQQDDANHLKAVELGCPDNVQLGAYVRRLEHRLQTLETQVKDLEERTGDYVALLKTPACRR